MTAGKTGRISKKIPDFPKWRFSELKRLGICFDTVFPGKLHFYDLVAFNDDYPGIEKGIVYSSGSRNTKGALLINLFNALKWEPKKIILIDDKMKNLLSFKKEISNMKKTIKFIGLHYLGAQRVTEVDVDKKEFIKTVSKLIKEIE